MSDDKGHVIVTEPIVKVSHIYGAEPAGIVIRMETPNGKQITVNLDKGMVVGLRDILQTALDHYLPPYPKGAITVTVHSICLAN